MKKNIQGDLLPVNSLNSIVTGNFSRLKLSLFIVPVCLLLFIVLFLFFQNSFSVSGYIQVQKNWFLLLNAKLSQLPGIEYNLAQLGDAFISLSILSVFLTFSPKLWEALISASLVTAVIAATLKKLFSVPRPAAAFDVHSFTIIGNTLTGHNSLPSGHSISIFMFITVLMFAFMPKQWKNKFLWVLVLILAGLFFAFTRVALGAHYPIDVITGCTLGYICGLMGIFISRKYPVFAWIKHKKYYPVFILLFFICSIVLTIKIIHENIFIYYLALACLLASLYKTFSLYVKK